MAQEFVNTAYSRALARAYWSGLRAETAFIVPDAYTTGTVTVTQGSKTVTGVGTTWTGTHIFRQFYTESTGPYYTIVAVPTATSLTLDRPYEKASGSGVAYAITQVYHILPDTTGPGLILVVKDLANNWRLRLGYTQEQLDVWDPERSTTRTPWVVASAPPLIESGTTTKPRYELWPRTETAAVFSVLCYKKGSLLSATNDTFIYPLRGDILRHGALAELAMWPGTSKVQNPYFSMEQHALHEQMFNQELLRAEKEDQDLAQTTFRFAEFSDLPYPPIDAQFLQEHGIPWR